VFALCLPSQRYFVCTVVPSQRFFVCTVSAIAEVFGRHCLCHRKGFLLALSLPSQRFLVCTVFAIAKVFGLHFSTYLRWRTNATFSVKRNFRISSDLFLDLLLECTLYVSLCLFLLLAFMLISCAALFNRFLLYLIKLQVLGMQIQTLNHHNASLHQEAGDSRSYFYPLLVAMRWSLPRKSNVATWICSI
jgi:hypothetical protein